MGFRGGRGGGGFRGSSRGGSSRGGRGGGGDRNRGRQDQGPPEEVVEFGEFQHECEGQLVVKSIIDKIPFFNAPIYLKNITQIGKIDEILGPITEYLVSIQLSDNYKASSFEKDQKLYIDPRKLLPLDRFLPKPPAPKGPKKRKTNDGQGGQNKRFKDDRGGNRSFGRGGGGRGFGNRDRSFGDRSFGDRGKSGSGGDFKGGDRSFNRGGSRGGSRGFQGGRGGRGGGRF